VAEGIVSQQTRQVDYAEHHWAHLASAFFPVAPVCPGKDVRLLEGFR
jgi:hypothetical protein